MITPDPDGYVPLGTVAGRLLAPWLAHWAARHLDAEWLDACASARDDLDSL